MRVEVTEDNFQESILSFHCVGFGDQTQVVRIGSRRRDPLSHLGSPSTLAKTIQTSGSDQADEEMNQCHRLFMALHRLGSICAAQMWSFTDAVKKPACLQTIILIFFNR